MQRRSEGTDNLHAFDNAELARIKRTNRWNRERDIEIYNDPQLDANGQPIDAGDGKVDGQNQQAYQNDEITLMRQ
ncbi:unnamed protein product [Cochlearia groenlandica]